MSFAKNLSQQVSLFDATSNLTNRENQYAPHGFVDGGF